MGSLHTTMDMHVRRASRSDRDELFRIWQRSVRATHDFLTDHDIAELGPLVAAELASDAIEWWVVECSESIIGFLGFANSKIEALFIDDACQRQGAGTCLVSYAQSLAADTLAVDVNEQNRAALRFYTSVGFVVVGRSPTDADGRPFPIVHMKR